MLARTLRCNCSNGPQSSFTPPYHSAIPLAEINPGKRKFDKVTGKQYFWIGGPLVNRNITVTGLVYFYEALKCLGSKWYQNNPGINWLFCSIPTNILTLECPVKQPLALNNILPCLQRTTDMGQEGAGGCYQVTCRGFRHYLRDHSFRFIVMTDSRINTRLFWDSKATHFDFILISRKSYHPNCNQTAKAHLQKNSVLVNTILFCQTQSSKGNETSWFYRKRLGLERITLIKRKYKQVFQKSATAGTNC